MYLGLIRLGINVEEDALSPHPDEPNLSPADQQKIRHAITTRRIDPADVPETAKSPDLSQINALTASTQGPTPTKRKAEFQASQVASSSQTSQSAPRSSQSGNQSYTFEDEEEDTPEEESKDELYCMLTTNVVGVQYYKGMPKQSVPNRLITNAFLSGLVGPGEEVSLVREPQNQYDRCALFLGLQTSLLSHVAV